MALKLNKPDEIQSNKNETKGINMKKLMTIVALCALTLGAGAGEWQSDAGKAAAQAKKENKLVLLDFTGSDWCGWLKR